MVLPVLDGLDAVGRFPARDGQDGISSRSLLADGLVVTGFADGGSELRTPPHGDALCGVKSIDAVLLVGDELYLLGAKNGAFHSIRPCVMGRPGHVSTREGVRRIVCDFIITCVNNSGLQLFGGDQFGGGCHVAIGCRPVTAYIDVASENQLVVTSCTFHFYQINTNLVVTSAQPADSELDIFSVVFEIFPVKTVELLVGDVGDHVKGLGGEIAV